MRRGEAYHMRAGDAREGRDNDASLGARMTRKMCGGGMARVMSWCAMSARRIGRIQYPGIRQTSRSRVFLKCIKLVCAAANRETRNAEVHPHHAISRLEITAIVG